MLAWCGVMLVIVRCNEPTVLLSLSLSFIVWLRSLELPLLNSVVSALVLDNRSRDLKILVFDHYYRSNNAHL